MPPVPSGLGALVPPSNRVHDGDAGLGSQVIEEMQLERLVLLDDDPPLNLAGWLCGCVGVARSSRWSCGAASCNGFGHDEQRRVGTNVLTEKKKRGDGAHHLRKLLIFLHCCEVSHT